MEPDMTYRRIDRFCNHRNDRIVEAIRSLLCNNERDLCVSKIDASTDLCTKEQPERERLSSLHTKEQALLRGIAKSSHWYPLTNL